MNRSWISRFAYVVHLLHDHFVMGLDGDIDAVSSYLSNKRKKYGFLSLLSYAKETVLPIRTKKGF
ncbi:hypothetical protein YQE_05483, partial [Dendroctonus ponderosae]